MFGVFRQSAKDSMQSFIQSPFSKKEKINFFITPQNAPLFEFDNDDEISFQGMMYDIVSKKQVADTMFVTCLMDDDETILVNNYNALYFNCISQKQHGAINQFHFFQSVYEQPILKYQRDYFILIRIQALFYLNTGVCKAVFNIVKPPPKVLA